MPAKQDQHATGKLITSNITQIVRSLHLMKTAVEKNTQNKDMYPDDIAAAVEDSLKKFDKLTESILALKASVKTVNNKKRHVSENNLGLRSPQYVNGIILDFINEHGDLPDELLIDINQQKYGAFDRSTMTTFWSYYANKNGLKSPNKGGLTLTDDNMNRLFNTRINNPRDPKYNDKTYYRVMVEEIKALQQSKNYKTNNSNRAQYLPADSDGSVITAFNNAALQILLKSFFQNDYNIQNKDAHVERLTLTKEHFMKNKRSLASNAHANDKDWK